MPVVDTGFSAFIPSRSLRIAFLVSIGAVAFIAHKTRGNRQALEELRRVIESPRKTLLPKLSDRELSSLPYPPDVLPGARDVDTPYGSLRVYEWGPESGRKVVLAHGISTPCISLAAIAMKLVERGCRVLLFDLFGRGYSSTPAPASTPHDTRLYTTQILLALASSPLPWTGTNAFALIGYSLGGGISTAFTAYFPRLVSSLVLIAPSGLVREKHIAWQSRLLYRTEGILPERLINWLVRRRLQSGPMVPMKRDERAEMGSAPSAEETIVADMAGADALKLPEVREERSVATADVTRDQNSPIFARRPHVTVPASVQWQIIAHEGFVPAFISAIRYGPITGCHNLWSRVGERLSAQKAHPDDTEAQDCGLVRGKVLVVLGKDDQIIVREEIEEDAIQTLGRDNVEFALIDAAHEVPITRPTEVADAIWRFWEEHDGPVNTAR